METDKLFSSSTKFWMEWIQEKQATRAGLDDPAKGILIAAIASEKLLDLVTKPLSFSNKMK
jgi:hypothetical protein